jgi:adenosylmethionine-8-amino-7-oxononanoate aminotransferase
MQHQKNSKIASHGKGSKIYLQDGHELIDLVSSWWVTLHGHGNEEIAKAIYEQALTLEHVLFADLQHEKALQLVEKLKVHLSPSLQYFFFSDDGSTAVEVALKMAIQYWKNRGYEKRKKIIVFEGSYHGDTVGAMSLGQRGSFNTSFQEMLFDVFSLPFPATYEGDPDVEEKEKNALLAAQELLQREEGQIAAVFIEPLVQGASGMRMCRDRFLNELSTLVRKECALLIYDEVMTGFGRTGEWFAHSKSKTLPDLLCLAKGLSGGFLPLALTVCTKEIFDAFCGDDPKFTFYHGHSYTANPIGCAAAIASLNLLEKEEAFRAIEPIHRKEMEPFYHHPKVEKIRLCGTIAAMDLVSNERGCNALIGKKVQQLAWARRVYLRPLGNVLYLMPPYCITEAELGFSYRVILECLELV